MPRPMKRASWAICVHNVPLLLLVAAEMLVDTDISTPKVSSTAPDSSSSCSEVNGRARYPVRTRATRSRTLSIKTAAATRWALRLGRGRTPRRALRRWSCAPGQRVHGGGEPVAAVGVGGEHVVGRGRGAEQDRVAGPGQACGRDDDIRHGPIVGPGHIDDRDIRGVSRQCEPRSRHGQRRAAPPPPAARRGPGPHQVVDVDALELAPGDPHHAVVGVERGLGRVRVGGLAVIDVIDAGHRGHELVAVRVGHERAQAGSDRRRRRRRWPGPGRPRPERWPRCAVRTGGRRRPAAAPRRRTPGRPARRRPRPAHRVRAAG